MVSIPALNSEILLDWVRQLTLTLFLIGSSSINLIDTSKNVGVRV